MVYDDDSFLSFLKNLHPKTKHIPNREMLPVNPDIKPILRIVFSKYIDVNNTNQDVILNHLKTLYGNNVSEGVKRCIVSEWIFHLDKIETQQACKIRKTIVEDYIFKFVR